METVDFKEQKVYNTGLNEIANDVQIANERWWVDLNTGLPKERNIGELLMLHVTELAEAMEGHRKNLMDDKLPQYKMFDVELVDCLIRLLDASRLFTSGSLQEIYEAKMEYNRTREDHTNAHRLSEHGKKY